MTDAQAADLSKVDAALAPFTADKPGLAVLVTVGGETVFERYLGGADLEHGAPVTAATRYHVASVSKQFTALAALLEAEAGRVDLAGDIHTYLPELADYGAEVTVADLVHHTSGIRDQWELMMLSGTPLDGMIRQNAIVAMAARQKGLNFPPGTDFRYSNMGYSLLAEIVARTSGKPFARYLEEAVFAPLGMRDTQVYGDASRLLADRAMSYRIDTKGEVRLARLNYSNYGATSLHTTARDLTTWARELMRPSLLGPKLIGRMTTPGALRDGTPLTYGFGIVRDALGGRPALTHGGGDAGFRAAFDCYPEEDASVIVLSNGAADVGVIARTLADAFLRPVAGGLEGEATPDAATLAALAGYYVPDWGPGLTLEAKDGKLFVSSGGAPAPAEAKFLPNGDFYLFVRSNRFSRTADGGLAQPQLGGVTVRLRRVERTQLSPQALAAFAGRYHSDEIDSTYYLAADETGLTLSSLRFPPQKLSPAGADAFDGEWTRLTFQRDTSGAPSGFTVSTGRVRGLPFSKVS